MSPPRSFFQRRGFSMVELLVAVSIIGLLVALAVPAFQMQAERSRDTACVAKLRNLGITMSLFRAERNNRLWNLNTVANGGEGSIRPVQILYKYGLIKTGAELCCPSAKDAKTGAWLGGGGGDADYMANIGTQYNSYAVNGCAFYQFSPWKTSDHVLTYHYYNGAESKTPLFMDGLAFQLNLTSWRPAMRLERMVLRHNDRVNVLFLDGHIESLDQYAAERIDPTGGVNTSWTADFGLK